MALKKKKQQLWRTVFFGDADVLLKVISFQTVITLSKSDFFFLFHFARFPRISRSHEFS